MSYVVRISRERTNILIGICNCYIGKKKMILRVKNKFHNLRFFPEIDWLKGVKVHNDEFFHNHGGILNGLHVDPGSCPRRFLIVSSLPKTKGNKKY